MEDKHYKTLLTMFLHISSIMFLGVSLYNIMNYEFYWLWGVTLLASIVGYAVTLVDIFGRV